MSERIRVFARVRPCADEHLNAPYVRVDELDDARLVIDFPGRINGLVLGTQAFPFDHVFWKYSTQEEIFNVMARPMIDHALNGINATIFAYGQTGSGKTYTITGTRDPSTMGIVPRAIRYLYSGDRARGVKIQISYLEIYNDVPKDLLSELPARGSSAAKVKILESGPGRVVGGLVIKDAATSDEAHKHFWLGECRRQKASTKSNSSSSRSHAIFTLYFECETETTLTKSKIHFVDLAGSEKYDLLEGAAQKRKKEAVHINGSLRVLQNVIAGLNAKKLHVPFRESQLTRFLKDSLTGNTRTVMMAMLSSQVNHIEETWRTCRFAESVASIVTRARVNLMDRPDDEMAAELRLEVKRLREERDELGLMEQRPRKMVLTDNDADNLRDQVFDYLRDDVDILNVCEPEQVKFCFNMMRALLTQKGIPERITRLEEDIREADEYRASLAGLVSGPNKDEMEVEIARQTARIQFAATRREERMIQHLKKELKNQDRNIAKLTGVVDQIRANSTAIEKQVESIDDEIITLETRISRAQNRQDKERMMGKLVEARERREKLYAAHRESEAKAASRFEWLRCRKTCFIAIERELREVIARMDKDFQTFWEERQQTPDE